MFHKYNPFTNTLRATDQTSAYVPQSLGTKEATNNFFVAPQPKGHKEGGSGPQSKGSLGAQQMSLSHLISDKVNSGALADTAQTVAATLSQGVATVSAAASNAAQAVTGGHGGGHAAVASSHGASKAAQGHGHGHGHGSHASPWEGVNLWRTPFKGDTDTITQVKRSKGTLDQYVENRTRRIQQLQLFALRNKTKPTWIMMPRDKMIFAAQGLIVAYVLYQVTTTVYQHLKSKDRLKLIKLLYKDNVN